MAAHGKFPQAVQYDVELTVRQGFDLDDPSGATGLEDVRILVVLRPPIAAQEGHSDDLLPPVAPRALRHGTFDRAFPSLKLRIQSVLLNSFDITIPSLLFQQCKCHLGRLFDLYFVLL